MPDRSLRLAIAQATSPACEVVANVQRAVRTVEEAREAGAQLVVFPELSITGYDLPALAVTPGAWLVDDDPRLEPLQRACANAQVTAVIGAPVRTAEGRPRIAAFVAGGNGELAVSFKEHVHVSERHLFEPGEAAAPFEVAGWRVAIAICFDAARPAHAAAAAARGADLYVGSALYVVGEERRADLHFGARAMDHRMYAALANHAGITGGHTSCGLSGVWGPSGERLVQARSTGEELIFADLDPAELRRYR